MGDLFPLLLLWLISKHKGGSDAPSPAPHSDPYYIPPKPSPSGYTVTPAAYTPTAPKWLTYKPLVPAVIDRAEKLLYDPHAPAETVEPDPGHAGQMVRYLKLKDAHTGHTNVTVWMQSPTSGPATPTHVQS